MSPEENKEIISSAWTHIHDGDNDAILAEFVEQKIYIATLKAALRQDRIERLLSDAGRFGIALDVGTAYRMAREQLAREMPDIFGDDRI